MVFDKLLHFEVSSNCTEQICRLISIGRFSISYRHHIRR
uniref:Uncharacterized protein n=1 Tax=Setaria italica TaxID=4555 RepID=K4A3W9_SETIT